METVTAPVSDEPEPKTEAKLDSGATLIQEPQNEVAVLTQIDDPKPAANPLNSAPSLYCPKNGRSHATLLDFNINECNICRADLTAPKANDVKSSTKDDDDDDDDDAKKVAANSGGPSQYYGQHLIEYRDCDGDMISREEWQGQYFNWEAARPTKSDERLVLQAIIRLYTETDRSDIEFSERKNLLANPKYRFYYQGTALRIYSDVIISALKAVALYPNSLTVGTPCLLEEPYSIIGHHLSALKEYASKITLDNGANDLSKTEAKDDKSGKADFKHFNFLFNWLNEAQYEMKIIKEKEQNARGVCTFQMLWVIIKPGITVYMTSQGILGAYVTDSVETIMLNSSERDNNIGILSSTTPDRMAYAVKLWNLQYDGRFVGRKMRRVIIPFFEGEKKISSLKIVPIEFYKESSPGSTRANLERLGQSWYKSLQGLQVYYKGRSIQEPEKQIEGRAYIDPSGHASIDRDQDEDDDQDENDYKRGLRRNRYIERVVEARCPCDQCHGLRQHPAPDFPWKDYDVIDPKRKDSLETPNSSYGSHHRYLVCDSRVWAIMLKTRVWNLLDIAYCSKPTFNENALEKLVMPKERKDMIKALVMKFKGTQVRNEVDESWKADFVEGKGEGTIFLLHGSPGVGKTYTAECIAEFTGRPLISLTCADIGTDEVRVEEKLEMWLSRAERWGAVLLIDEADVFLEKRQISDIKRNSLVSVFLRCLEYYRGILFLTTNRVGHFDDAFISRIHVVITYEALGELERKQIWAQFFEKLEAARRDFEISRSSRSYVLGEEPDALYKQSWNGREIRNVFQTAVALAEYRAQTEPGSAGPTLKSVDFEQVCDMTKHFKKYLDNIYGENEDQRAYTSRARLNIQEFSDFNKAIMMANSSNRIVPNPAENL